MPVLIDFTAIQSEQVVTFGPYAEAQLLINELWVGPSDKRELLAAYETYAGWWHVFGLEGVWECTEGRRRFSFRKFNLVTIRSI